MALYTFYPGKSESSGNTYLIHDLEDDAAAERTAELILVTHPSCASVNVWCGDRYVMEHLRAQPAVRTAPIGHLDSSQ